MSCALYTRVPRDLQKNLRWRKFVLAKAKGDKKLQQALLDVCKADIIFWINTFVYQTNPDMPDSAGPFVCWKHQERAIISRDPEKPGLLWCIENGQNVVFEKSRKQGATWLVLIVKDWKCRFTPYYDSLMMSKSAAAVEGTSRQSLFGKVKFIHEHLPDWMHDRENFSGTKNNFIYPGTNSSLLGFSSTGKAGVSERGADFFIDEFAQIEEDYEVLYRTQATARCRIFVSTHLGTGTAFHTLCQSDYFAKISLHWTQHPNLNKGMYRWNQEKVGTDKSPMEWLKYNEDTDSLEEVDGPYQFQFPADYDFDKTGEPVGGPHPGVRSPEYDKAFNEMAENKMEMAKDWDINPSGSVGQFYQPLVIKQLIDEGCRPPLWECDLEYDKLTGEPVKLIIVPGGMIKLWCNLDHNGKPPKGSYGAGADISGGTGCTPSSLSLWASANGEKVLEYQNANIYPEQFAILSLALCRLFCDHDGIGAKIAWENHGPGTTFGNEIWEKRKYLRVYCVETIDDTNRKTSTKPGWNPSVKGAKRLLHDRYRIALYLRRARNHSKNALAETLNFKHDGKGSVEHTQYKSKDDPAGGRENHGDVVVADALGWMVIEPSVESIETIEAKVARPGTAAWLFEQERKAAAMKGERYSNWDNKRRSA